ncbi:MAG: TraR/DksA C4-type zinc finger protein [Ilumatobacteraceae bacterium]
MQRATLGIYGLCIGCGSPIGEERLAAIPHAETCVSCQERR